MGGDNYSIYMLKSKATHEKLAVLSRDVESDQKNMEEERVSIETTVKELEEKISELRSSLAQV